MNNHIKELLIIALSTTILVVQELAFSFLPNIQLTTFLMLVYTKVYGFKKTTLIVFVYIFIDNLLFGSLMMLNIVLPMIIAWMLIVSSFSLILRVTDKLLIYVVFAYIYGHIYGLVYVPFQAWILEVDMVVYLIADIPWEIVMGISNAVAVLWLYEPLSNRLKQMYSNYFCKQKKDV